MKKNAKAGSVRVILPEAALASADDIAQQSVVIWPVQPRLLLTQASAAESGERVVSVQAVQSTAQSSADLNQQQAVALSTAAVAVTAANAAPVVLDEEVSVQAGVLVTGSPTDLLVNDTDPDGDVLTIIRYGQPAHGTFTQNPDGSISYIANVGYAGPDELTYTVSDGQGNETVGTLRLTITPAALNQAPVVQDEYLTLQAGVLATGFPSDLLANDSDADGDALRIVRYGQPSHGTFTQNPDGSISYISEPNFSGEEVITYTVSDGQGHETTGALRLTIVGAPNTAPTAVNDSAVVAQDSSVTIAVLSNDTDPEQDVLTVSTVGNPANGVATLNADGRISYVPRAGFTGTDSFSYTVSDGKGGSSTAQVSVTVQASAPDMLATADTGASNSDNITSNTRAGFTIPAPPVGSIAVLLVDGVEVAATYNATVRTLTPNAAISEGDHQISYGYKPSAGGALTLTSGALSISIDAIKETPGQIDLAATSDSGGSATDNLTNVTKPVFNVGPLPKTGDVFNLYINNVKVAATYDAATGTLTPTVALTVTTHSITTSVTNAAGVESARSPALSLVVDTTAPTTYLNSFASKLSAATDLGLSNSDGITSNNKPSLSNQALTRTYFAEAGAVGTADLLVDGVKVASVWDKVAGTLTPVNALTDGPHTLSFTRTDSAGNETTASTQTYRITVDTSTPVAPTLTPDMLATADSGASNSDNITSNTRPGFVVGDPLPGGRIDLLVDGVAVAATYTAATKTLVPNVALSEGSHTIAIVNVSAAGAQSAASPALTMDVDAVKETPALIDLADSSDSGGSNGDNITNVTKPVFNVGPLPKAGDVAELYVNNIKVAASYDAVAGTLTPVVALVPGTHAISWTITNAAGVVSAKAPTLSLVVDTSVPTPLAPDLQSSSDTGTSTTDNITAQNQPTFTVATLAAGELITVLVDGQPWAATLNDTRNAVTLDKPLSDGDHQISLRVTDVAGNVSLASAALKVSIRTMAPEVSKAPDLQAASDTGASSSDDLTATPQPVFSIPLPPVGATAALYVDGLKVSATYSSGTLKPTVALSEGPHLISYTLTDTATGAESALSPVLPVRIGLGQSLEGGTGDDTLRANTSDNELAVSISLGGGTSSVTTTASMDQVWSGQGGNDWVDAGDGNDWVDVGATAGRLHSGTGQAASTTELAATVLMSTEDWRLTNSTGSLVANALGTSAADSRSVQGWANVADAGWGDDVLKGGEGVDLLYGNAGDDHLSGAAGQDGLRGGVGDDVLVGGQGSDVLRGDDGQDTFRWMEGDAGSAGAPARDVLLDFSAVLRAEGGDVLDLRDLLSGEARGSNGAVGNLERYLDIDFSSLPGSTVIHVSSTGLFNGSNTSSSEDQTLVLSGIDVRASLGLGLNAQDAQVIEVLLAQGNLLVGP